MRVDPDSNPREQVHKESSGWRCWSLVRQEQRDLIHPMFVQTQTGCHDLHGKFLAAYNTLHPDKCDAEIVPPQSTAKADQLISPNQMVNTWSQWQDNTDKDTSFLTHTSWSYTSKVPGTIEANHTQSYTSIVARHHHHHSNISSPTKSCTGHQSMRVTELELENKCLWSRLQEMEKLPISLSTCSKSSTTSKREVELETEVNQVKPS